MGLMPESMSESKMYGVEIDSITGRIARQLYQKNSVAIQGYESSELPDSFFDVAIGNVPFGDFKLLDRKYNKHNFLIHDYFFAKTLDKVRPGGVIAFITSSGIMDKRNSKVRKYIAQRADLIGAIRLPNNTFKKNAGTEVTADILFLQKRERMTDIMPEWVEVGEFCEGQFVNRYFLDNPDMVMGELKEVSGPFGPELTCVPNEDISLAEQLDGAIQNIHASITEYEFDDISNDEEITIPADPNVRNFSFTVVDGDVYFRENSLMRKVELNATAENRVKGMIKSYDSEGEDGFYPIATFSSKLTTELLKKKLGFDGAVVTDALIMGGMATGDIVKETVQAFKAGADFLLWPPIEAADAIEEAINNGSIPMSRLDDALERIGKMEKFRLDALEKNKPEKPDPKFIDKTIVEIAKHGMCLLRNEIELVPIKKEKAKNILIVDATDENSASSYLLRDELVSRGFAADVKRDIYDVPSRVCWQSDIDKLQSEYDIVIFSLDARFVAQWSEAHMLIWASHLFDKSKKIIVNYGSPYFAVDYFPEDPTFIEMNCKPTEESVKLLVDGLLGELQFTGKCILKERNYE